MKKKIDADVQAHKEAKVEAARAEQHKTEREVDEKKSKKEEMEKRERAL